MLHISFMKIQRKSVPNNDVELLNSFVSVKRVKANNSVSSLIPDSVSAPGFKGLKKRLLVTHVQWRC